MSTFTLYAKNLRALRSLEWLRQFRLGELYADDGIVSNDDENVRG